MSTLRDRRNALRRRHSVRLAWPALRAVIAEWRRRARSRHALARLGAWELRDIGLSHADRLSECRKPFWRG
jgi:uncharacterized protein YjiS (DUF1127 family)